MSGDSEWEKGRLIFDPRGQRPWMASHGCTPTALVLKDRFRVLFAPRNEKGRSIPSYVDLALNDPATVIAIGERPIMELGELGAFDDGGIMPCSVVRHDGRIYLYYVGWNASVSVPYRNAIGLSVSEDDGRSFKRLFPGAVVDRNRTEPFFTASPCVVRHKGVWHMFYASTVRFDNSTGKPEPVYVVKHATSDDGIEWRRNGEPIMPQLHPGECQARPSVLVENGSWTMWFCTRDETDFRDGDGAYRISRATSGDGVNWARRGDDIGPARSLDDFDGNMQAYPNVVEHNDARHLFYNGNGFGEAGIGYARQTRSSAA